MRIREEVYGGLDNIIHICFSTSAGGSLEYGVKNKKILEGTEVIIFEDDISHGPIGKDIDIDKRISWWKQIIGEEDIEFTKINNLKGNYIGESYEKFYKNISKIKPSDIIYLWYGECSSEFCALLHTLEILKDKLDNIYLINVSEKVQETPNGDLYKYRALAEVIPEKLKSFINSKIKIQLKEYETLMNQFNLLKNDYSLLRIFKEGKLESVAENFFDVDILKYTEKTLKKSARTVGSVIGFSEVQISDEYIFWRIKELIKLGMIAFKGTFGVMREMEIKITQKGLDYINTNK